MPAYLLVNAKGSSIETAPIDMVSDRKKTAGSPAIVNGLSCMACHDKGIKPFADEVRRGMAVNPAARDKVNRLFRERKEMDRVLREDEERFSHAIVRAMRPYWRADVESDEPIYTVAFRFQTELGPAGAAAELGVEDDKKLLELLRAEPKMKDPGLEPLSPLVAGGKIKRSVWETRINKSTSLFQEVGLRLDLGAPLPGVLIHDADAWPDISRAIRPCRTHQLSRERTNPDERFLIPRRVSREISSWCRRDRRAGLVPDRRPGDRDDPVRRRRPARQQAGPQPGDLEDGVRDQDVDGPARV